MTISDILLQKIWEQYERSRQRLLSNPVELFASENYLDEPQGTEFKKNNHKLISKIQEVEKKTQRHSSTTSGGRA